MNKREAKGRAPLAAKYALFSVQRAALAHHRVKVMSAKRMRGLPGEAPHACHGIFCGLADGCPVSGRDRGPVSSLGFQSNRCLPS